MVAGKKDEQCGRLEGTKRFHGVARACLSLLAITLTTSAWAGLKLRFDLKADRFPTAILEFHHQSNYEVVFPATADYTQIRTQPVFGEFEITEALDMMLKDTGLHYYFDTDHSVVIAKQLNLPGQSSMASPEASVHHLAQASDITIDPSKLEQVVVTGTLIHGVADVIAPLVYVTRQDLQQASYATVQDALYELPLNSMNGAREDLPSTGNLLRGAGINLRGLGSGATLVLVNGHRQPVSGFDGDFVDVSNIPWSAVKRVEVLPDGASAIYGSDAVAGVVNIILRDDLRGAESQARIGGAPSGAYEKLASQLFGTKWSDGKLMVAYQYSERTALAASDRFYAANSDKTSLGGADYRSIFSNPGNILSSTTFQPTYGVPPGQNGIALTPSELSSSLNLENRFAQFQLFPERRTHSFYATASQNISNNLQLFMEGRFSQRDTHWNTWPDDQVLAVPRSNPYFVDPFAGTPYVLVAYSFLKDFGPVSSAGQTRNYVATAGTKYLFGHDWQAVLSETYGHEALHVSTYNEPNPIALAAALADRNPLTAFNPFGDGSHTSPTTLNSIRLTDLENADSGIQTTNLTLDGPVFRLPGGEARLAVGAEHRQETFYHWTSLTNPGPFGRNVNSAFAELSLPLQGDPSNSHAVPRLELTLAGRYEHYSDFGQTTNPQIRLRWIPLESVKLRSSWGKSFRAPKLVDLYDTSNNADALAILPDPQSPSGRSLILDRQGNNPDLKQETAKTWTAGVDWVPAVDPGFVLSLTYYGVDYEGRIVQPGPANPFDILVQESVWAPVITRNPSRAQIDAICSSSSFKGSQSDCLASTPAAIVDFRLSNLASTRTEGLDLDVKQKIESRLGNFELGLMGNYVTRYDQRVTETSPARSILDTIGNALAVRLRATAGWARHQPDQPGLGLNVAINHTGGYRDPASTLAPRISPWTTVDCRVRFQTQNGGMWWDDTEVSVNATNVFNQNPPFADTEFGYDVSNTQPLGRIVSLFIRKNW